MTQEKERKNDYIFVRYAANSDWPNIISHKDPNLSRLTKNRTRKFNLENYEEAWKFLLECKSPITKLASILWAFPRKKALDLLAAMDDLKRQHNKNSIAEIPHESLRDYLGGDNIEDTLEILKYKDKSFIELYREDK